MPTDVFQWPMDASMHEHAMQELRTQINEAHRDQRPLTISVIFELLPIETEQAEQAIARGEFTISGDKFENTAQSELQLEFSDPAMGQIDVSIPRRMGGTLKVSGERIQITFDPDLLVEIPKLEELGVDRSIFQRLVAMDLNRERSVSVFEDDQNINKVVEVHARLAERFDEHSTVLSEWEGKTVTFSEVMDIANQCSMGDPDDPNWYVYRRRNDGLCFVHYGRVITGGQIAWDTVWGPGTKADAQRNLCQATGMLIRRRIIHGPYVRPVRICGGLALGGCIAFGANWRATGLLLAACCLIAFSIGTYSAALVAWRTEHTVRARGPEWSLGVISMAPVGVVLGIWILDVTEYGQLLFMISVGLMLAYSAAKYGCWVNGCCRRRRRLRTAVPSVLVTHSLPKIECASALILVLASIVIVFASKSYAAGACFSLVSFAGLRTYSYWLRKPWVSWWCAPMCRDVPVLLILGVCASVITQNN